MLPLASAMLAQVATMAAPPAALAIPRYSQFVFLAGFDGSDGATSFIDESMFARAITRTHSSGTCELDTAQKEFGTASLLVNGGDYIFAADAVALNLGSDDFTVGCWVRFNVINSTVCFIGKGNLSNGWMLLRSSGNLTFYAGASSVSHAWTPAPGQWYFIMADRTGGVIRLYIDGMMVASASISSITATSDVMSLSRLPYTNNGFHDGWLDETFVLTGQALCGSDAGFTVPASAFVRGSRYESNTSTTASSSAFAAKGQIVDILNNITLDGAAAYFTGSSGTYKMVVAELDTGTNLISAILDVSADITITAAGYRRFTFPSPIAVVSGKRIAFIAVRTDGTSTSICSVAFPGSTGASGSEITYYGTARAATLSPAIGDTILYDTASSVRVIVAYS